MAQLLCERRMATMRIFEMSRYREAYSVYFANF